MCIFPYSCLSFSSAVTIISTPALSHAEASLKFMFGSSHLGAMPWMADALEDLKNYFARAAAQGRTRLPGPFNGFNPVRSYRSVYTAYSKYATDIVFGFNSVLASRTHQVVATFDEYAKAFVRFMENQANPFTFASYFGSSHCGVYFTGLAAGFKQYDANSDQNKRFYLSLPELTKYLKGTANFGLRVDINAPWRVVADLASEPMRKYLLKYNIGSIDQMFTLYYMRAVEYELFATMELLKRGYKEYQGHRKYGVVQRHCVQPSIDFKHADQTQVISQQQLVEIEEFSEKNYNQDYDMERILRLLEKIKKAETRRINRKTYTVFQMRLEKMLRAENYVDAAGLLTRYYNGNNGYGTKNQKRVDTTGTS